MPDFTRLRLVWEPRMLSISRIMIGLLFMEHGTAKVLDFPHQETHKAFDLLTVNPGAQGSIELIGGFLFALGLLTRPVAFLLAGDVAVAYFMAHAPRGFFAAAQWRRTGDRLLFRLSLLLAGRRR
jgi:putative oxidoreductase